MHTSSDTSARNIRFSSFSFQGCSTDFLLMEQLQFQNFRHRCISERDDICVPVHILVA